MKCPFLQFSACPFFLLPDAALHDSRLFPVCVSEEIVKSSLSFFSARLGLDLTQPSTFGLKVA